MPTQLQFRRGTTAQNNSFTGVVGELSIDTDTDNIRVHDGSQAGGFEIIPSGTILPFGGSSSPGNFLLCDGSNVSRTTYARLFAVIGTAYGAGDGSTTFGLPDLQDRVPLGKGTNNATLGTETGAAAASSVITNASSNTGTGNTGTGNTGTGNTGTGNTGNSAGVQTTASTTGTGNTGTGNTGTGTSGSTTNSLSLTTGTFASSAKDSSTASAVTNVTNAAHTHTVPALTVPALSIPGLTIPALDVDAHSHSIPALTVPALSIPALSIPALSIPALTTTLPTSVVNYIIKT